MKKVVIFLGVMLFAKDFVFCTSCHNGRKEVKLSTLTKQEIVKKLHEFKKSKKGTMSYIAKGLSEKDIKKVAEKYGK
ncbi:c-type cytochrome [Caminibacter pacificus]|jgi:cytochrome c553